MALPPGFLDELRSRLTLSDIVGRRVVWDRRKSQPGRGDWWGPCPFHQEKTPSFHVDDRKGFFHCFGCAAKGDLFSFVMETENLSFMEAVEQLAADAGMTVPSGNDAGQAKAERDRSQRLIDVLEKAVRLYQRAFRGADGAVVRDYAAGRGLDDETLARFEIGFAPDSRTRQTQAFREAGLLEDAVAAGLVIRPDDGGAPYDRFRNRLMFPIRDRRGRAIAFGGRAMAAEARAKYLNSPETPVFHKGRTVYNHARAQEASARTGTLVVAEGYMDVIALDRAGIHHAVAPLGTAITADQLQLLWRMADEPVVALDGDAAGLRAADRLVDLALPLLQPGKSLRFCVLPEGQDPDDLIRSNGPAAMAAALEGARPLIEQLWLRETAAPLDTPERRAAFDRRLQDVLKAIGDATVREHYRAAFRERRRALLAPKRPEKAPWEPAKGKGGRRWQRAPEPATASLKNSALARGGAAQGARIREGTILLIACQNPDALGPLETALETMQVTAADLVPVRAALLAALVEGDGEDAAALRARLSARLGADPAARLAAVPQAASHPLARAGQDPVRVRAVLAEALERHAVALAYDAAVEEGRRDLADAEGEDWTWRLRQAGEAFRRLDRENDDVPRESGPSKLQEMLDAGAYRRGKRPPRDPN